jgi:Flp pilus assembly protein TadD
MIMSGKSRKQQLIEMLEDFPDDGELRYFLAMEHVSNDDTTAALYEFNELQQRAPDYVPGYVQHGQLLAKLDREDEARAVFRAGIAVAGRVGDSHAAGEMEAFLDGLS